MIRQTKYKDKDYIIVNTEMVIQHDDAIELAKIVVQVNITSVDPKYRNLILSKIDTIFNKHFRYIIQKPKLPVKTKPWYKFW